MIFIFFTETIARWLSVGAWDLANESGWHALNPILQGKHLCGPNVIISLFLPIAEVIHRVEQFVLFFLPQPPCLTSCQGRGFLRMWIWAWFHSLLFTLSIVSQKSSRKAKWLRLSNFRKNSEDLAVSIHGICVLLLNEIEKSVIAQDWSTGVIFRIAETLTAHKCDSIQLDYSHRKWIGVIKNQQSGFKCYELVWRQ